VLPPQEQPTVLAPLFEAIVRRASVAVAVWQSFPIGAPMRLVLVNDAFCDLTGYEPGAVLGLPPGLLAGTITADGILERCTPAFLAGHAQLEEHDIRGKDGERTRVETRSYLVRGTDLEAAYAVTEYRDVTALRREEERSDTAVEELRRSAEWAQALVQRGSDLIFIVDDSARITWVSPSTTLVLGYDPAELLGVNCLELAHPDDATDAAEAFIREVSGLPTHTPVVVRARHKDESYRMMTFEAANLLDNPAVAGVVITARDVTTEVQSDALLVEEAALLESVATGTQLDSIVVDIARMVERAVPGAMCSVGVMDGDGVVRHPAAPTMSKELVALLDASPPDCELGAAVRSADGPLVFHHVADDPRWGAMRSALIAQALSSCWVLGVRGSPTSDLLGLFTLFHPDDRGPSAQELPLLGRAQHLAAIAMERARFESRLEHQALHDSLTGLPNRTLLLDRLEHALARAERDSRAVAVLFIDLDSFKVVNDSLGHAAGDELLGHVAERLAAAVPATDTVGRFGGDEFVVLCEDIEGEADAVQMAERLAAAMQRPFALAVAGAEVVVRCSIGIALTEGREVNADALVRDADAAMYRAKDEGRNRYALFEPQLHSRMLSRLQLEHAIHQGLARDELRVAYQPIVRLADGRIVGVEALVRWERPGHGLVGAVDFVPVAEETGLIVAMGAWVLRAACEQIVAWDAVVDPLNLSVNLSARQLADPSLVATVERTLEETGLAPSRLCLEVTESALASDADSAVVALAALKELGVRLAIDDFGTGYATLDYVRRFSMADELKIDRSFVAGLTDIHVPDAAIVSASIVLANALGFDTVAEGVESPEQLAVLRRLGCQYAQGYWFSRPVPADELTPLLPH
jgi:diguanylate cyclase (GGDEF)-like protein/PAS domain S-box-containing protein